MEQLTLELHRVYLELTLGFLKIKEAYKKMLRLFASSILCRWYFLLTPPCCKRLSPVFCTEKTHTTNYSWGGGDLAHLGDYGNFQLIKDT